MAKEPKAKAARTETPGETRVLSVIGEASLANVVDLTLRHGSYTRRTAGSVSEARSIIGAWKPHLLLVNIDVEEGRAIQLIDDRDGKQGLAVIALTRRADLRGKLDAFERGADDYITVPLVPDDLIARTRAVLRRTHGDPGRMVPRVRIGDLEIDVLNRRVVSPQGHELHLTSLEQALLYLLAANAGTVLTREQILDALWGTDFVIESNVVDRHVRALRAKLQNDWHKPRYIETVAGTGYRFVPTGEPE
ncbi:MAG TPA: response regulator transcription factor [Candidatus Limnocylindria bacterium]|nr:response regulator transcription factor [Candidatus Limnocylindria bacterium]